MAFREENTTHINALEELVQRLACHAALNEAGKPLIKRLRREVIGGALHEIEESSSSGAQLMKLDNWLSTIENAPANEIERLERRFRARNNLGDSRWTRIKTNPN